MEDKGRVLRVDYYSTRG